MIWILYIFFWVFPRRQIVVGRRFRTLYEFHLQRLGVQCTPSLWRWNWCRAPKRQPTTIWRWGNTQKKIYNKAKFVINMCPVKRSWKYGSPFLHIYAVVLNTETSLPFCPMHINIIGYFKCMGYVSLCDLRLLPCSRWELLSSGLLCSEQW